MKVALILTGHMRCWRQVWPYLKAQFIDRYTPDVYVSTWSDEGWWRPNSTRGFNEESPILDVEEFKKLYNPVDMEVEEYKDVEEYLESIALRYDHYIHKPKNVISMFYKIAKGFELVEKSGKEYDLVIRMRPDLVFNHMLEQLDPSRFYTTHHPNYYGQGTGDTFQASSYENIQNFCKTFYLLDGIYAISNTLCPHVLAKTAIDIMGCTHIEVSGNFKLVHSPYGHFFDYDESKKSVIIDVGSNDHNGAKRFLIKNNIEVHTFEPVPDIFDWVEKNIHDYRLIKNRHAIDIKEDVTTMYIAGWEKWFCSSLHSFSDNINEKWKGLYHHSPPNFHYTKEATVTTIRLDTYCLNKNITQIDYLDVSASGNDFNVLKSLGYFINFVKQGKVVAFADTKLYNSDNNLEDILAWLKERNFECHVEYDDDRYRNEAEIYFSKI